MSDDSQSWTQTVDTLFTTTWAYRKKKATEQAFKKTPLLFWLRERGRVEFVKGYRRIEIPLEYGSNDTVRWIGKGDTVPITDSELLTMAYEDWKYGSVSIVRFFTDDQQNRGAAAVQKLVDVKLGAAERALNEEFESVFFGDASGAKEPNGFQNLIASSPSTGTVHGINRANYDWWRNQQKTATGSFSVYGISDMRTCMNDIIQYTGSEVSDLVIVTNQSIYEYYEDECFDMKVLQNTMLAEAGFTNQVFKGRPMIWSPSAPSGNMYFVHTGYLKLVCDEDYWMDMTDWKQIPNQPNDRVAQIVCVMNLTISRAIVHKVLSSITA